MSTKAVTLNLVKTPAPNVTLGETVLGKVVEPARTRWQPGSLVASAIGLVESACFAVLTPSGLRVFTATSDAALTDWQGAAHSVLLTIGTQEFIRTFTPALGTSLRSRGVENDVFSADIRLLDQNDLPVTDPFMASILLPSMPSYTASTLINKIDSFFQDVESPSDYLVILDQVTGNVVVTVGTATSVDYLDAIDNEVLTSGASLLVAYDLAVPSTESEPPAIPVGPMWG